MIDAVQLDVEILELGVKILPLRQAALRAQLPALAPRIIGQIDGRKTVAEIYTSLGAQGGLPQWEDFYAQFEDLYVKLNGVNHLLLRFRTT